MAAEEVDVSITDVVSEDVDEEVDKEEEDGEISVFST